MDASTLGKYNSHFSNDILAHFIAEPIPGNCFMWSACYAPRGTPPFRIFRTPRSNPASSPSPARGAEGDHEVRVDRIVPCLRNGQPRPIGKGLSIAEVRKKDRLPAIATGVNARVVEVLAAQVRVVAYCATIGEEGCPDPQDLNIARWSSLQHGNLVAPPTVTVWMVWAGSHPKSIFPGALK